MKNNKTTLSLVLTHRWFDEIKSGRKSIEYRKMTDFWKKRIWDDRDAIQKVRFYRGYTKTFIERDVDVIDIGSCFIDGWDGQYYRIWFT